MPPFEKKIGGREKSQALWIISIKAVLLLWRRRLLTTPKDNTRIISQQLPFSAFFISMTRQISKQLEMAKHTAIGQSVQPVQILVAVLTLIVVLI